MNRRPVSRTFFATSGFVVVLSLLGWSQLSNSHRSDPSTQRDIHNQLAVVSGPCGGLGAQTTLSQVMAAGRPFTIYVPSDPLANASNVASVWSCPGTELEFQYSSGINIYTDVNGFSNPARAWQAMADQDPNDTTVGTVLGQPAALIDPAKSSSGANGSVSLVLGGTRIVVEGNGQIPLADLVRVSSSLQPAK